MCNSTSRGYCRLGSRERWRGDRCSAYLYMCRHTTTYASVYYIFVLILLHICPHTTASVLILLYTRSVQCAAALCFTLLLHFSSSYYICPHTTAYTHCPLSQPNPTATSVLILLHIYPHTTVHTHTHTHHTHAHTHTQSPTARHHSLPCPIPTSLNQPEGHIRGTRKQVSIFFLKSLVATLITETNKKSQGQDRQKSQTCAKRRCRRRSIREI